MFTEDLTKALEEAKEVKAEDYTDESYDVLSKAIAKAEALLEEEKPSQEAIDAVTKELKEGIKALVDINLKRSCKCT